MRDPCASDQKSADFGCSERLNKRVSELGKLLIALVTLTPFLESAGFGFESRGAHEPPGQSHLFLKVAAEMARGEPKREPRNAHLMRFAPSFMNADLNVMLFHSSRYGWTRCATCATAGSTAEYGLNRPALRNVGLRGRVYAVVGVYRRFRFQGVVAGRACPGFS